MGLVSKRRSISAALRQIFETSIDLRSFAESERAATRERTQSIQSSINLYSFPGCFDLRCLRLLSLVGFASRLAQPSNITPLLRCGR